MGEEKDLSPEMGMTKDQMDKRAIDSLRIANSTLRNELQNKNTQYALLLKTVEWACVHGGEEGQCVAFGEYDGDGNFIPPPKLPNLFALQKALEGCYDRGQRIGDDAVGPVEAKMHAREIVRHSLKGLSIIKGEVVLPMLVNVGFMQKLITDLWKFIIERTNHSPLCHQHKSICTCGYENQLAALDARVNPKPEGFHEYKAEPLPPGVCPECGGECQVIDADGEGSSKCFTCQGSGVVKPNENG